MSYKQIYNDIFLNAGRAKQHNNRADSHIQYNDLFLTFASKISTMYG